MMSTLPVLFNTLFAKLKMRGVVENAMVPSGIHFSSNNQQFIAVQELELGIFVRGQHQDSR
jgi:hypothetical protein